jgi:hypothetical protein
MDLIYALGTGLVGLIIGFVISFLLSIKHKWYRGNSIIILILGFIAFSIDRLYWNYLRHIFMYPGSFFKSDWAYNFTGAIVMLTIGLSLFFVKGITRFINGKKYHTKTLTAAPPGSM